MTSPRRKGWTAALSLVVALALTIVPLPAAAAPFRPDFAALVLLYWALYWPQRVGLGVAFVVGLVLDTLKGAVLGQHALALCIIMYIAMRFHLRIRVFPLGQQMLTILMLLVVHQFVLFWIDGVVGTGEVSLYRWGTVLTGTLMWPIATRVLRRLRLAS